MVTCQNRIGHLLRVANILQQIVFGLLDGVLCISMYLHGNVQRQRHFLWEHVKGRDRTHMQPYPLQSNMLTMQPPWLKIENERVTRCFSKLATSFLQISGAFLL